MHSCTGTQSRRRLVSEVSIRAQVNLLDIGQRSIEFSGYARLRGAGGVGSSHAITAPGFHWIHLRRLNHPIERSYASIRSEILSNASKRFKVACRERPLHATRPKAELQSSINQ